MKKGKLTIIVTLGIITMFLMALIFIQFKTVEKTNLSDIENLRETELREQLSSWKTKYQEVNLKIEENLSKIQEYEKNVNTEQESSELLSKELEQTNILLGKVDCIGEGVVITLNDNDEYDITASDLLELINELNYAGAEAISINGQRLTSRTDIVDVGDTIIIGGQRIADPYEVRAIGNQKYLTSTLSLKDTGFIDKYSNSGKSVKLETSERVIVVKYNSQMKIKYIRESVAQ
ncbi:MAG: DUF881 domain-containing protein [Clostridia bacterium]|nr:DUF881 domain-containing protein [Clostridia bacterium]